MLYLLSISSHVNKHHSHVLLCTGVRNIADLLNVIGTEEVPPPASSSYRIKSRANQTNGSILNRFKGCKSNPTISSPSSVTLLSYLFVLFT